MTKYKQIRLPQLLWEEIQRRAEETYHVPRQEVAFLSSLLFGNPATSTTNQVAALEKPINKKNKKLNSKGKKFLLYEPQYGGTQWEYDEKEIDQIFLICESIGEHAVDLALDLTVPEDYNEDDGRMVEKANKLYKLMYDYRKQWRKEHR